MYKEIKAMKKMILIAMSALLSMGAMAQSKISREARLAEKARQEVLDKQSHAIALQAFEDQAFVLQADRVIFKRGETAYVNSNTNFVMLNKTKASVQVAFDIPVSGPNGLGGVTVDGNASGITTRSDKKGFHYLHMNVLGTGISASVDITLYPESNRASVTVYPNFNSNQITLEGELVPLKASRVFKGSSL